MSLLRVNYQDENAPALLEQSLKTTGFVILTNHPIHRDDVSAVYAEWEHFFTSNIRHNYLFNRETQEGYSPKSLAEKAKNSTVQDIKEQYQLYFPWGRYPACLSNKTRELFYSLYPLGIEIACWLEEQMPDKIRQRLACLLKDMMSMERSQFRMLYYPALTDTEKKGALRAAPHEDINLITLLPAATTAGLEMQDTNGKWYSVITNPGDLIINIGDMLQEATGYFYNAAPHRVINPPDEESNVARLSMPLFMHPSADIRLSDQYPKADLYLQERLKEIGFITEAP